MMALFKYFTVLKDPPLPDPNGSLSKVIERGAIEAANEEVKSVLKADKGKGEVNGKRGPYLKVAPSQKALVGQYAAENGVVNAKRHFQKDFPKDSLKESTIRGWRNEYCRQLKEKKRRGEDLSVSELPPKKVGRPLSLGEDLDKEVQAYLLNLREVGGVVNGAIARASAKGIIRMKNSKLLASNGGHIVLTKDWSRYLLQRMGFVKRKANTKAKICPDGLQELKSNFLSDIAAVVELEEVPPSLVINWDHTGLKYVPVSSWTMAKEGSKKVPIAGLEDKRQITAVFGVTMEGHFLPPQLIYQGKTVACLPSTRFPSDWHVTYTPTHWANESTTLAYIEKIILPYVQGKRKDCNVSDGQRALCIFYNFKAQLTDDVLQVLEDHNIDVISVPPNCTDSLQPLDLSVNKSAKDFLRSKFEQWYAQQIFEQGDLIPIKFPMTLMKPLGAQWVMELYSYMLNHPEIMRNGFRAAGILDVLK